MTMLAGHVPRPHGYQPAEEGAGDGVRVVGVAGPEPSHGGTRPRRTPRNDLAAHGPFL